MKIPFRRQPGERSSMSLQQYIDQYLSYQGHLYPLGLNQTLRGSAESIGGDFAGIVQGAYKANGPVFACITARMLLFSEARFQFRQLRNGRPGDFFGTAALAKLERPWLNATTGDLLSRMELDASLAGNFFGLTGLGIRRMRPDWVDIVLGSKMDNAIWDPNAQVLGYAYTPGGRASGEKPILYLPEEVVHYAPLPDPEASYRGMSWLQPVIDEVLADKAATNFKGKFFEAGGTPNILVEFDKDVVKTVVEFDKWVAAIREQLGNQAEQHRALFLAGGTKGTVVGANLDQMEYRATQGAGETRIAAAARVPVVIAGFSEGLQGSSLNQGNYEIALRQFVDLTMVPLWTKAAGALSKAVVVPGGAELAVDLRDIAALRAGETDAAEIVQKNSQTIAALVTAGFTPESATPAVLAGDLSLLEHSGLLSVQMQPPGSSTPPTNGSGDPAAVPAPKAT